MKKLRQFLFNKTFSHFDICTISLSAILLVKHLYISAFIVLVIGSFIILKFEQN